MKEVSLETLRSLENYVYHGSAGLLKKLVPSQPTTIDRKTGRRISDGKPAVVATPFIDIAIFRSIVNPANLKMTHRSSFGLTSSGKTHFAISKGVLDYVRDNKTGGYVYALPGKLFSEYSPKEVRSSAAVEPEYYAVTTYRDLPPNINNERV